MATSRATTEGLPYPLGVSWCAGEAAYHFALYSKHATVVRLLLFGDQDLKAPLGMITACDSSLRLGGDRRPRHEADAVIYELQVRGFTQHASSGVSDRARGAFAGLIEKIPYLRKVGVSVVEWMPVFQFDPQARDFWGYSPISFLAPHRGYAARGSSPSDSFRAMVSALLDVDIEVVLDVVYNLAGRGRSGHANAVRAFLPYSRRAHCITIRHVEISFGDDGHAVRVSGRDGHWRNARVHQ